MQTGEALQRETFCLVVPRRLGIVLLRARAFAVGGGLPCPGATGVAEISPALMRQAE